MGDVVRLVQGQVSDETIRTLRALLAEARAGHVVGLAYVAFHQGREYSADVVGTAKSSPTFTRGTLRRLDDYLAISVSD